MYFVITYENFLIDMPILIINNNTITYVK